MSDKMVIIWFYRFLLPFGHHISTAIRKNLTLSNCRKVVLSGEHNTNYIYRLLTFINIIYLYLIIFSIQTTGTKEFINATTMCLTTFD